MEKRGRTYEVPCSVNGLNLSFILDTGADNVSISQTEALFMIKNGYLNENDLLNTEYYRLANGQITEGTKVILREMIIGGLTIKDVEASVVHSLSAPLLFGQSALEKLDMVTIDYEKNQLIISRKQEIYAPQETLGLNYVLSGIKKHESGDLAGALEDFNMSIKENPDIGVAWACRGHVKNDLANYNAAILDLTKAIELDSLDSKSFNNRGKAYYMLGSYNLALSDYNKSIKKNPINAKAYNNRAVAKEVLGNQEGALSDYNIAITLNPNIADIYHNRGTLKYVDGDLNSALEDINEAIKLNPEKGLYFASRADIHEALSNHEEALLDHKTATRLGYP
jgi:clan AA aspartic protease (TIGR02281 family)